MPFLDLHQGILEEFSAASYKRRNGDLDVFVDAVLTAALERQRTANRENMRFVRKFKPHVARRWRMTEYRKWIEKWVGRRQAQAIANRGGVDVARLCQTLLRKSEAWAVARARRALARQVDTSVAKQPINVGCVRRAQGYGARHFGQRSTQLVE
jgi:hypothetical protein